MWRTKVAGHFWEWDSNEINVLKGHTLGEFQSSPRGAIMATSCLALIWKCPLPLSGNMPQLCGCCHLFAAGASVGWNGRCAELQIGCILWRVSFLAHTGQDRWLMAFQSGTDLIFTVCFLIIVPLEISNVILSRSRRLAVWIFVSFPVRHLKQATELSYLFHTWRWRMMVLDDILFRHCQDDVLTDCLSNIEEMSCKPVGLPTFGSRFKSDRNSLLLLPPPPPPISLCYGSWIKFTFSLFFDLFPVNLFIFYFPPT